MKYFFILITLVLLIPIAILFSIKTSVQKKQKIEYIEGVIGQPRYIHPILGKDNDVDMDLVKFIYRKLLNYDHTGKIVPDLVDNYEISENGKEYIFNLKQGIFWHDGEKFTSDDVIYTCNKLESLKDVKKEKIGDFQVKFILNEVFAPFLDLLTIEILPEHIGESILPLKPIGTGDYKLEKVNYKMDFIESIELVSTGNSSQEIKNITFKFFNNKTELITSAKLGEVDSVASVKFDWPSFNIYSHRLPGRYFGLFINLKGSDLLKDLEFRKVLATSVNRNKIIDTVLDGEAVVINSPIEDSWATIEDINIYNYNPNLEKKYDDEISIIVPNTPKHIETAEFIKKDWEKLGLKITIKAVELQDITEKIIKPHNFDILLLGQEVGRDPDRYTLWHSTKSDFPGLNFTSYKQVRVDKALEKGRTELNTEERKKHYAIFQRLLTKDIPVIYLYQPIYYYSVSNKISGINFDGFFSPPDRFNSINSWTIEKQVMVK